MKKQQYLRSGKQLMHYELHHGILGAGTAYDDYSENSYGGYRDKKQYDIRFPHDRDASSLNGEVIIVQKGKKKDE